MKTAVPNSFLKLYVMGSPQIDLLDIVQVKVGFFAVLKMCIRGPLGKFVWSTLFEQCENLFLNKSYKSYDQDLKSNQKMELKSIFYKMCQNPLYSCVFLYRIFLI